MEAAAAAEREPGRQRRKTLSGVSQNAANVFRRLSHPRRKPPPPRGRAELASSTALAVGRLTELESFPLAQGLNRRRKRLEGREEREVVPREAMTQSQKGGKKSNEQRESICSKYEKGGCER
jgi:hypothetical protein